MIRTLHISLSIVFLLFAGGIGSQSVAQVTVAADDASNYTTWGASDNSGGYGFGDWVFNTSGVGNVFVGSSTPHGGWTNSINSDGQALGLWNSGGAATVARRVVNPDSWGPGAQLSVQVSYRFTGTKGINIQNASGSNLYFLDIRDDNLVHTGGSRSQTAWTNQREFGEILNIVFTQNESSISYNISGIHPSSPIISGSVSGTLHQITFFNNANEGGDDQNFYINNFEINKPGEAEINGPRGWRVLSSPVETTYNDLIGHLWTQGFPGSDGEQGFSNVRVLEGGAAQDPSSYVSIGHINDPVESGRGFLMFVYELDNPTTGEGTFPKILNVSGTEPGEDVSVPGLNPGVDVYSMIGNPFLSAIDFDSFSRDQVYGTVWAYDYSVPGFISYNGTGGDLTDGLIGPFNGYFVRSTGATPELTIPRSAKSSATGAELLNTEQPRSIRLHAESENGPHSSAWITFRDSDEELSADQFYPLDYRAFMTLFTADEDQALDIRNLPYELAGTVTLPLHLEAWQPGEQSGFEPMTGFVTLTWPEINNIPPDWNITLMDTQTGEVIDLMYANSYEFTLDAPKNAATLTHKVALRSPDLSEKSPARFNVILSQQTTSTPADSDLPREITLNQNYPNPFNPTTQISYDLPEAADVRLEIYNVQGQRISTLVNARQSPGTHHATFNAGTLASGVYIYRLQAGNTVLTRKLMLVK